ncbi:hypothetical protein M9H77_17663 [Catharanthus roseus]|uniref:Uncharacterized protein n=1 Tax=Catharanthus roseus TaxID=4058 RepID=A0ACC0B577_CATRO|nr:hypothetical protein M9H77_17663 [Catharanthus roseus]
MHDYRSGIIVTSAQACVNWQMGIFAIDLNLFRWLSKWPFGWIHLKRGVVPGGFGPISIYVDIASCSTYSCYGNRALVWCLAGIDYEMPELFSDDLVMGSELCPWSPTVALHIHLNSGVEAVMMCLDSLRLPSYARTPHVGQVEIAFDML